MSLVDYSLWSTWQALYDLDAEPDLGPVFRPHVRLSYHRAVLKTLARENANACITKLGWLSTQKIAFFGCGFGWTVEVLQAEHGFTNIVGIDTSQFIQTNKATTEEADINAAIIAVGLNPLIGEGATVKGKLFDGGPRSRVTVLNEDGRTPQSRTRIKQALAGGGGVDIAFTEDVLGSWADADCQAISAALHQLAGTVQHLITLGDAANVVPIFQNGNWKPTLAAWKALLPADTVMSSGDFQVL